MKSFNEYDTEYKYVLTNKDADRIANLIHLLGETLYEIFEQRALLGTLAIEDEPSLNEMMFHEQRDKAKNDVD